jgi:hypothetical protein
MVTGAGRPQDDSLSSKFCCKNTHRGRLLEHHAEQDVYLPLHHKKAKQEPAEKHDAADKTKPRSGDSEYLRPVRHFPLGVLGLQLLREDANAPSFARKAP